VPVIILIAHGIQFFSYKKSMQALICLFVILVLVGQGHSAFIRNFIWKTEESLWLDAVDKSPNLPRVHHNLGRYYGNTGQREKAIVQYEEALRLKRGPHSETHHLTHFNLALIYINTHEEDKAIEHLQKAIEIVPYYADAYNNLAIITAKRGRYDDAYNLLIRSLTYDRNSSQAHNNLGYVLLKTNRTEEAIIEFEKALHLEDNNITALHNLGIAHKYLCHLDEAARCFKTVLRRDPKALFTRLHLAETYWLMGKKDLAKRTVSATLDLIPPEAVYPKTKVFFQEDSFEELPDSSIILPLLRDAYLKRCVSLEKMAKGLGEGTEKD
jgi:tetratricopeptide (TPR) repeat protein